MTKLDCIKIIKNLFYLRLNYYPQTYNLPGDYSIFFEEFKKGLANPTNNVWIMKPVKYKLHRFQNLKEKEFLS